MTADKGGGRIVLSQADFQHVKYLFAFNIGRLQKEGLQYLAIRMEQGAFLTALQRVEAVGLLRLALSSPDWRESESLRMWTYILGCHMRDHRVAVDLWRASADEHAPHLTTWACLSVAVSTPPMCDTAFDLSERDIGELGRIRSAATLKGASFDPVSYTHLTLPTSDLV